MLQVSGSPAQFSCVMLPKSSANTSARHGFGGVCRAKSATQLKQLGLSQNSNQYYSQCLPK